MSYILPYICLIFVPLIITNVLHMIIVRFNFFSSLNIPIWMAGLGANKTWRGFIFVPVSNLLFTWLLNLYLDLVDYPVFVGFLLGLAYILFELPNSMLKRKIGIPPGGSPEKGAFFFKLLDKTDSPLGVMLTCFLLGILKLEYCLLLFFLGVLTHALVSQVLVLTKIKASF